MTTFTFNPTKASEESPTPKPRNPDFKYTRSPTDPEEEGESEGSSLKWTVAIIAFVSFVLIFLCVVLYYAYFLKPKQFAELEEARIKKLMSDLDSFGQALNAKSDRARASLRKHANKQSSLLERKRMLDTDYEAKSLKVAQAEQVRKQEILAAEKREAEAKLKAEQQKNVADKLAMEAELEKMKVQHKKKLDVLMKEKEAAESDAQKAKDQAQQVDKEIQDVHHEIHDAVNDADMKNLSSDWVEVDGAKGDNDKKKKKKSSKRSKKEK